MKLDYPSIDDVPVKGKATPKLSPEELEEWENTLVGTRKTVATSIEELKDKEKAAIAMVAMGASKEDAAKALDLEAVRVGDVLASKVGLELLCKIQDGLGLTPEERLYKAVNLAIAKQIALANSENDRLAAEASRYIIDQAVGKALQRAEIRSTSVNVDATSIHAKYEATQEQLRVLREQRRKLLQAKQGVSTLEAEIVD